MSDGPPPAGSGPKPGMPRWVKVFVMLAIVVIVLVVVGLLTGRLGPGGPHGPGRHLGSRIGTASPRQAPRVGGPADQTGATRPIDVASLDALRFEPGAITII